MAMHSNKQFLKAAWDSICSHFIWDYWRRRTEKDAIEDRPLILKELETEFLSQIMSFS